LSECPYGIKASKFLAEFRVCLYFNFTLYLCNVSVTFDVFSVWCYVSAAFAMASRLSFCECVCHKRCSIRAARSVI